MGKNTKKTTIKKTISQLTTEVEATTKNIEKLEKDVKKLIKQRLILEGQKTGKKIDAILDDLFIKEIRGNGKPSILEKLRSNEKDHEEFERVKKEVEGNGGIGLCEKYRSQRKMTWVQWGAIVFLVYLALGGNFRGITWETIKEKLGITVKQVEQPRIINEIILLEQMEEEKIPEEEGDTTVEGSEIN